MKLSLKFPVQDDPLHEDQHTQIMTAKVPITVLSHPFISGITATTTHSGSDFSFSLSTNFSSGPSFKLSYCPTAPTTTVPFFLSLKSGLGIFGSPINSPLVFSANFTLSSTTYTPVPAFFLHFKPQCGHFSLKKTVFSDPNTDRVSGSLTNGRTYSGADSVNNSGIEKGFVADGSSSAWQELKLEPCDGKVEGTNPKHVDSFEVHSSDGGIGYAPERSLVLKKNGKYGLSSGVTVMARTAMPVTKGLLLNLRWDLNFPGNSGLKMPYLTVNKIGLERVVEEVKQNKQSKDTPDSDLQLMKGMCLWMRRDLEIVEKENREMKQILEEMKLGASNRKYREGSNSNGVEKKFSQYSGQSSGSSEFERWRGKKNGREENGQREPNQSQSLASDVESELQKAIKAAASS